MISKVRNIVNDFKSKLNNISTKLDKLHEALGRIETRQISSNILSDIELQEFGVYSQWGEDGIIQSLLRHVDVENKVFVEFGVENYKEANTRFLLINNNWSGLVIDGSEQNVLEIKSDPIYWRYNLKAECAFITKHNINELMSANGIAGDIGLLSIDIDGNDYWIWQNIHVISPRIVIAEYNWRFGVDRSVTIPYKDTFVRSNAHYSMIYYGASLKALVNLGKQKGYSFVGCNRNGVNAFFVRRDVLGTLKEQTVEEGYIAGKFREARKEDGSLAYMSAAEELQILNGLPLIEV